MVDNDLVFNRYYIKTLKVLFKQFENDPKAGSIQTSFRYTRGNYQGEEEARELEDAVSYGFSHRWELGLWRESWEKMKPFISDYFELTRECDFDELVHNSGAYQETRKKLRGIYETEHADFVLEKCVTRAGYEGLHTLTLRHKTIGRVRSYDFKIDRFDRNNYAKIELHQVGNVEKYKLI